MKNGFAVFFAVVVAFGGFVVRFRGCAGLQLGKAKQEVILNSTDNWPLQRTGDATLGLQVYRANGCAACHTEQIRQDGVAFEVTLTGLGNPKPEDFKAISSIAVYFAGTGKVHQQPRRHVERLERRPASNSFDHG